VRGDKIVELRVEREILGKLIVVLEKDPDVLFAYLFGSTASGLNHPYSDLDIACYVTEGDEVFYHKKDRELLENLPDKVGGHRVDLHLLNTMPTLLKFEVVRNGQELFVRDQFAKVEFETTVLYRYFDMKPFLSLYYSLLEEKIRSAGR